MKMMADYDHTLYFERAMSVNWLDKPKKLKCDDCSFKKSCSEFRNEEFKKKYDLD